MVIAHRENSLEGVIKVINPTWLGLFRLFLRGIGEVRLVASRSHEMLNDKDFMEECLFKLLYNQIESCSFINIFLFHFFPLKKLLPTYKSKFVPE